VRSTGTTRSWTRPSLNWLLVFVPVSLVADLSGQAVLLFITSALAIIPLAGLIGSSTEQLAIRSGPRLGGLLNATFGNLTELIVAVLLVEAGDLAIVKASLIGSIVGNLLLVLGLSFAAGGFRRDQQRFSAGAAGVHSSSLVLAVAGLLVPALLVLTTPTIGFSGKEVVSLGIASVLILVYLAAIAFTQVTHAHLFRVPAREEVASWSLPVALAALAGAAILVGAESELLVSSLRPAIGSLGIPPIFVGLILIPVIGNAAEHAAAVRFAIQDKLDVTLEIAVGSSTQVAMFIAPLLVFVSLALGRPMDFVFTGFEVAVVALATLSVTVASLDGRSNWLEGVQLVGAYLVIAVAAFFLGPTG
jgi:Ca2+:H+ antiporter